MKALLATIQGRDDMVPELIDFLKARGIELVAPEVVKRRRIDENAEVEKIQWHWKMPRHMIYRWCFPN